MGNKPIGSRFRVYEAATEMIRISDNTATNLMIKRLGECRCQPALPWLGPQSHRD